MKQLAPGPLMIDIAGTRLTDLDRERGGGGGRLGGGLDRPAARLGPLSPSPGGE
jgi:hypothetical protein